jgi:hypothetical protein
LQILKLEEDLERIRTNEDNFARYSWTAISKLDTIMKPQQKQQQNAPSLCQTSGKVDVSAIQISTGAPTPIRFKTGICVSSPMLRLPMFKSSARELMATAYKAPKENRTLMNDSIKLYEEKRNRNLKTAENAINRLTFATSNKQIIARA